ncbi:GroES molecular chaperone protein [Xanthomonas phage BUDD]|nr:GroES molecular chaperone protein [Xanthomonas phage BUDD]
MSFKPVNTFVIVKRREEDAKSQGGIIISGSVDKNIFTVVAKNDLVSFVEPGDTVIINIREAAEIDDVHFAVDAKHIFTKVAK